MSHVKSFNEMNAEQRFAYRIGYRAALTAHQRDLDALVADRDALKAALRWIAEDASSLEGARNRARAAVGGGGEA